MLKLTLNKQIGTSFIIFLMSCPVFSQIDQGLLDDIGLFLDDALLYSEKYITPATDAAVYQASAQWMVSPKKRELWDFTLGLHTNLFFVPNRDRTFEIQSSDFSLMTIQGNPTSLTVPTALGGESSDVLLANLGGNEVQISVPEGVNLETVVYPYLQGAVSLWGGTELMMRYSTKVKLKKGYYQVYGLALQHNLSQYSEYLQQNNIHLAVMGGYSNEDISFDFLNLQTDFGDLGLSSLRGLVDTYQFQIGASKSWNQFELMTVFIINKSWFEYQANGTPTDALSATFNQLVNEKLKEIYKSKINTIGEISGRYQFNKFFFQTSVAFGKFVNLNASVQYSFF
jgi:hypothetical protein